MTRLDGHMLRVISLLVLVLIAVSPFLKPYTHSLMFSILLFGGFALAWGILSALTGYLSFGHMAFFAAGAYSAAYLGRDYQAVVVLVVGALSAAAVSVLFIVPTLRLRGMYFALASLGLGEIMYVLALEARWLTGGPTGTPVMAPISKVGALAYLGVIVIIASLLLSWVRTSRLGLRLAAMRSDEGAAEAAGIPTRRYKVVALLASAAMTGLVGVCYGWWLNYAEATNLFELMHLVTVVAGAVLGGLATLSGGLLGALVFGLVSEQAWLTWPFLHEMITGVVVMLGVLFLPRGFLGTVGERLIMRRARAARGMVRRLDAPAGEPSDEQDAPRTHPQDEVEEFSK